MIVTGRNARRSLASYKGLLRLQTSASVLIAALALSLPVSLAFAQTRTTKPAKAGASTSNTAEQRAVQAFDRAKAAKANALELESFLRKMPKGADLHMHLSGAIYAETFLKDAVADGLCVDPKALAFAGQTSTLPGSTARPACPTGDITADNIFHNQTLYDGLIDSFSMRSFVPSAGVSGHDQFFATFGRFGGIDKSHTAEWLDEVATRASAQNEQYLEVMVTPSFFDLQPLWKKLGWPATPPATAPVRKPVEDFDGDETGTSRPELDALRTQLLAGGMKPEIDKDVQELEDALAARDRIEHCGQPNAALGCGVKIRFIYQILRANPPEQVFAQTLLGFEVAQADPHVVGINFVQPEDAYMAMSEYDRQMHMLDYLRGIYPSRIHISLHAGELAPGLVTPDGLRFHIREAVDLGHAERIGHGVDVMHELAPNRLLQELAAQHIMVEINLTSNDVILGVKPPYHPLPVYREAHVPVALSTDDEGVSRIDLTHEYVRAALEYDLGYLDLKQMARTSIEHSFLPGDSIWAKPDDFTRTKPACSAQKPGTDLPSADCLDLLKHSEKAAQQWELEHRFAAFEASQP